MTPEQEIYLANRAKEVVENEAYQDALAKIKQEIFIQWTSSPARDEAGREKLWLMQALLTKLQQTLETTMSSGKLATLEVQHRSMIDKAKSWLN